MKITVEHKISIEHHQTFQNVDELSELYNDKRKQFPRGSLFRSNFNYRSIASTHLS